ncbi:UDP-N-acetylenolpyruvoylglucosamine reductase [Flavobacterium psychrophilum]|uniref:UDP-N-acetylenolpyruvoylglucosamine reductase n=1 Tax=Flavobacterium psychrophilum (strain ATCC 49511 / DSM 21280 / CIP 103535 / JIP02/86) TaxID=402612 RepID=A6H136_FLAPJ|nr:UDP-N-acetylmuramate dehydrogenase [Flavobacterium psychrophilum]AIG30745.1 UDP-N-acetylenolpyruvoylglucosamine reductase [Flavobacterium psychrophilum]AIG33019.1 UDP-N-acetylenolpyruvoylglucosamine reductase [Flavobacterium psychrophilum]AIG35175.1 UDP-N-acetylenolpyruvoylglucosamine reductase [Flavobacterium psychrophilum]AIG37539.1 UDP-N-acetylenolpyruvoylglucosamine reductase [Flavobacterium psychrophilum]AIG39804.1 UDP-N-acetylenolpyruvoylglucosamine reductase [Flavobacterium psychroph
MTIISNFSLKKHNTFGIDAKAKQFVAVHSVDDLQIILKENQTEKKFILGGGSNMLLTKDIDALVIHIDLKGKKIIQEDDNFVWVESQAGENWHEFVLWTINQNFGGLENMSLIPGNVGTTPVQNIGAYGAEIKDTFVSCKAMNIATQEMKIFTNTECHFGYRESVFKHEAKDQYIITSVIYKLTKKEHKINISYGDIKLELANKNIETPSLIDVSNAIITIRQSKLPDPKVLGNSGSFFKNPIVLKSEFEPIHKKFPEMKFYEISDTQVKVPAGWLIEQAGFKGKRFGDAGIHKNQALVLVNYGNATGQEILNVSEDIQKTVFEMFGISIEAEVNVI